MEEAVVSTHVDAADLIRLLTCSELRKNLVLTLRHGPASLADLRQHVDVSSTAAIHALRELEKDYLTFEDDKRNYALTNVGAILAHKLEDLTKTAYVLAEHSTFWLEHDVSGIPESLLGKLGWLEESYLITSSSTDMFKVYSTFTTLIENARDIKGVTAMLAPDMINVFVALVTEEKPVELAITCDVYDKLVELADRRELRSALQDNLKLFKLRGNPKIGFTVTDYFLSLGLFGRDGIYDFDNDLLSYSAQALEWGRQLFEYYATSSEKVVASDISVD